MRKTILTLIGVLIIVGSVKVCSSLSNSKKSPKKKSEKTIKTVVTKQVKNVDLPIKISSTGSILAKERAVLYSEVQGVFQETSRPYKAGVRYRSGQPLIQINNTEFAASVKAQRVTFKSLITGLLADIQFDYPTELSVWKKYAASISPDKKLPALPEVGNENLVNYITIKNVYSSYYSIKNLETRLEKYTLVAPFSGVLVVANITPGTLVSPGQKLGEFIKPGIYELELNVNASLIDFLKVGETVTLSSIDHSNTYQGTVSRINSQINRASQTVQLFVQVNSNNLNEGEYLEAKINAETVSNVMEIDRNLIVDQNQVFIVQHGALSKQTIAIVHANENTVIVKGLKDSMELIATPVPGGYEGMKVSIKQ